jgi:hypothetical protein
MDKPPPLLPLSNITLTLQTAPPQKNINTTPHHTTNPTKHNTTQHNAMRLLLLTTLLALIATACAEKDYMLVRRMNRDITQAINIFCGTTEDMVSPTHHPTRTPLLQGE